MTKSKLVRVLVAGMLILLPILIANVVLLGWGDTLALLKNLGLALLVIIPILFGFTLLVTL